MRGLLLIFSLLLALPALAHAAPSDTTRTAADDASEEEESVLERFELEGYGVVNYFSYDWETQPDRRDVIDLERLVLYPGYRFSERLSVQAEVEFEHGGTGVTQEFERFEEGGEFETEVEQGGEVSLEQLHLQYAWRPQLGVRLGRLKVPVGLAATHDEPPEYFTTTRSEMETRMIPVNWYENGVQLYGRLGGGALRYQASLVNGLDASGFSSDRWVATGHQTRFEEVRAEDFAGALRLDYFFGGGEGLFGNDVFGDESAVGLSAYYGDSADNRPRPDLREDAGVTVLDGHLALESGPLVVRGLILYGHLANSAAVTSANQSLPSALGVEGTPVGSEALGYLAEAGYDILSFFQDPPGRLDLFARYEFYDTMQSVEGEVFDNPRYERTVYTGGLNYHVIDDVVLKAQYARRVLGLDEDDIENTFSAGLGFEF